MVGPQPAPPGEAGATARARTLGYVAAANLVLPIVLGAINGSTVVALNALGGFGLLPLACTGTYFVVSGRRSVSAGEPFDQTAEVAALAWICWTPVVLLTGVRDEVWRVMPSTLTALGAGALLVVAAFVLPGVKRTPVRAPNLGTSDAQASAASTRQKT